MLTLRQKQMVIGKVTMMTNTLTILRTMPQQALHAPLSDCAIFLSTIHPDYFICRQIVQIRIIAFIQLVLERFTILFFCLCVSSFIYYYVVAEKSVAPGVGL